MEQLTLGLRLNTAGLGHLEEVQQQPAEAALEPGVERGRVLQRGADERMPILVEFRPVTGRPHQIRLAAAAALGAPLLGDLRYGGRSAGMGGGGTAGAAALGGCTV